MMMPEIATPSSLIGQASRLQVGFVQYKVCDSCICTPMYHVEKVLLFLQLLHTGTQIKLNVQCSTELALPRPCIFRSLSPRSLPSLSSPLDLVPPFLGHSQNYKTSVVDATCQFPVHCRRIHLNGKSVTFFVPPPELFSSVYVCDGDLHSVGEKEKANHVVSFKSRPRSLILGLLICLQTYVIFGTSNVKATT